MGTISQIKSTVRRKQIISVVTQVMLDIIETVDQYKTTTAAGSVNAYTIPNSDFGAYRTNEKWLVDFTGVTTNSGAATLNRNGLGAISIKMPDGTNPTAGILTGRVQLSYNGTYFYLVGGAGSGGGTWGSITGTLSSQTDLQSALDAKQASGNYITALTGDITASGPGSVSSTVTKINGTSLAGLGTGILKNTTGTGVPSIAVAGDFPTLNQNTTGSAATLTTSRTIGTITGDATSAGSSFNGSANNTNPLTLATVNSNVGTFGSTTKSNTITVNGKGLITAISEQTVTPAVGSITGLGTGIGTWLVTPSSANLASSITDETGSGALVFGTSPTLTTPALGTPSALILTNATGLPPTTGISGWPSNSSGFLQNNGSGTYSYASIDQSNTILTELGNIITDNFNRGSIGADWSNHGSGTFALSGNKLNVSGGSNVATDYLQWDTYGNSNAESFTCTFDLTIGTINATSYGVGLSLISQGGFGTNHNYIKFALDSTNQGKIYFGAPILATTNNILTISAGDVTSITIKFIKDKYFATWVNTTTGYTVTADFALSTNQPQSTLKANSFKFAIACYGGAAGGPHLIDNFIVNVNDSKNVGLLAVGDSITSGLNADNVYNRYTEQITNLTGIVCLANAGPSNITTDINLTEVINLAPTKILLMIGTNDAAAGTATATIRTRLASMVTTLQGAGYVLGTTLFIGTQLPRTGVAAITTVNSDIITDYSASGAVVDFFTTAGGTGGFSNNLTIDSIHPNSELQKLMAEILINKLGLVWKSRKIGNYYPVQYAQNGGVSITESSYRGYQPTAQVDVITSGKTQFRGANSTSNTHLGVSVGFSGGASYITKDMDFTGTQFKAGATSASMLQQSGGDFFFYSNTGLTIGNTVTATNVATIKTTGKAFFGGSTTPTAFVHLPAGTTAATTAPFKLTTGTSMTTAEAGAMEYTTPQLFFTNGGAQRQEIPQIQQSRVSTQFDKTNNTTLANITGLTATLVAGKIYRFEAELYTTSNVTGGVQFAISGTATATAIISQALVDDAGVTVATGTPRATAISTKIGDITAVTNAHCRITGLITVNAAGTLTVQFAQNASNGTASSVLVGSHFVTTEMN